ncbi:fibronectin type III domain-containing protein [Pseudozobellia thermophila]|nr:fibronectin type III domain-containing protein [Pseudozobellia thermophila]
MKNNDLALQHPFTNPVNGRGAWRKTFGKGQAVLLYMLLFFLCFLGSLAVNAQSFPVQVIPQVTPPAPIYFSDYADASTLGSPLRVQIILNDFEIANREIRLRTYFEGGGISFHSNDVVLGAEKLYLEGGVPLVLTNVQLAPYFRFENISGISPNVYGKAIPEGAYSFCFEVYDVLTGNRLSQKSCATSVVFQNEPPFLVAPRNKSNLAETNPQNIVFQWTPRHINVSNVEYELSIVEIWDTQVDPQQAFLSSPPVFQVTTTATTYVYGPADPLFLSGKNYAWRVQAKAKQGVEEIGLFKNQGYSEIYSFSYAGTCDLPIGINHEVKGSTNANIFWDDFATDVPEYTVRYRQKNIEGAEWFMNKTTSNQTTLWDLKAGTTYEYQVQKQCSVTGSDWSMAKEFTTFIADDEASVYDCGITPDFDVSNKEPLPSISSGEKFMAGDFPINILKVSGKNGRFTGKGYVTIPYLNSIRVGVEFTNVLINTDKKLAEGTVVTTYDPSLKNILDINESVDTVEDAVDAVGEFFEGDNDLDEIRVNWALRSKKDIKIKGGKVVITNPNTGATKSEPLGDDMVITDSEGKTYYVDAEGKITEGGSLATGGAISPDTVEGVSNNGQIESLTAEGVLVTFNEAGTYAMDIMPKGEIGKLKDEYTVIKDAEGNDYVLTHHAVKNRASTKIKAKIDIKNDAYDVSDVIFKTKHGDSIPTTFKGNQATLTLKGRFTFENEVIYAVVPDKDDSTKQLTAGAFTLWHLSERTVKVALVSVNGASLGNIESNVSDIFKKAVARIEFGESLSLSVTKDELGSNQKLDVGESAWAAAYNEEQKMLVNKVKQLPNYKTDTYYVLVFNDIEPSESIGGFMPLQRQMGFVFGGDPDDGEDKNGDKSKTLAHEIGHGIFALQHPFAEYDMPENQTDWLMDYGSGDQLPHTHWAQIHDPALKFYIFQDEEDGLLIQNGITPYLNIHEKNWDNYCFLSPIGTAIDIPGATHVMFNEDGAVIAFKIGNEKFLGLYNPAKQRFIGYLNSTSKLITKEMSLTEDFRKKFNEEKFTNIKFAEKSKDIVAIAKKKHKSRYLDCIYQVIWENSTIGSSYTGISTPPFIPNDGTIENFISGNQCANATSDGIIDGPGDVVYFKLFEFVDNEERIKLIEFSNYLSDLLKNKTFAFYGYGLENYEISNSINKEVLNYLTNNKIYSKEKFEEHFPIQTFSRDKDIIFSTIDLRKTIPKDYNSKESIDYEILNATGEKRPYEYSFSDLTVRLQYLADDTFIKTAIHKMEAEGRAEPISQKDGYNQYVAKYGTDAAFILWAEFASNASKDVMSAYFIHRVTAEYGVALLQEISKEAAEKFIWGVLEESIPNYLANELLDEDQFSKDFFQDALLAGVKNTISPTGRKFTDVAIEKGYDCLIGLDISTIDGLLFSKSKEELEKYLLYGSFECVFPMIAPKLFDYVLKGNPVAKKVHKYLTTKLNIDHSQTPDLMIKMLGMEKNLKGKSEHYRSVLKEIITTESGAQAIDVLIKANFDYTTLSVSNLRRLKNVVEKWGNSNEMVELFKSTTDVNRMLIYMEKMVKSPQEYKELLKKIGENEMFSKTITINGKTVNIETYFNSFHDGYTYYHKQENNIHYYAKMNGADGLRIIIDLTNSAIPVIKNISYGTAANVLKDFISNSIEYKLDISDDN